MTHARGNNETEFWLVNRAKTKAMKSNYGKNHSEQERKTSQRPNYSSYPCTVIPGPLLYKAAEELHNQPNPTPTKEKKLL